MPGDQRGRLPRFAVKRTDRDGERFRPLVVPVGNQADAGDQAHQADQEDGANPDRKGLMKSLHEIRT